MGSNRHSWPYVELDRSGASPTDIVAGGSTMYDHFGRWLQRDLKTLAED